MPINTADSFFAAGLVSPRPQQRETRAGSGAGAMAVCGTAPEMRPLNAAAFAFPPRLATRECAMYSRRARNDEPSAAQTNPAAFSTAKTAPLGDLTADSEADWHPPHERHHAELASGPIWPFTDGRQRDSPATAAKQDKIRI